MSQHTWVASGGEAWRLPVTLRRLLLLGPPLGLAVLEIFHPQPDVSAQAVMDVATWFATFHAIQLVLIGMVALSVLLLADSFGRAAAWTTRLGIGVFLVFFSAYDSVAGIGTGLAMRSARDLPAVQQDGIFAAVKDWPGFDPATFSINVVGTLAGWSQSAPLPLPHAERGRRVLSGSSSGWRRCS